MFKVTFPLILPAISASALLTFVLSIADFGTPRIIGRDFNVLATEAFNLFGGEVGGNPGMASALSMVLIILSMGVVFAQRWVLRRNVYHSNLIKKPRASASQGSKSAGLHALAYAIVLRRRAAGHHRGDLLVPPHQRAGFPAGLQPAEL